MPGDDFYSFLIRGTVREIKEPDNLLVPTINVEKMGGLSMLRLAAVFFIAMASTAMAQTNRTELKRADLTGTDKEIIIAILEVPPGSTIDRHTHPGEEAVYVLEGATLQFPDGKEVSRPAGQADGAYRRQRQADDGPGELNAREAQVQGHLNQARAWRMRSLY
jgi:hypothetical protein